MPSASSRPLTLTLTLMPTIRRARQPRRLCRHPPLQLWPPALQLRPHLLRLQSYLPRPRCVRRPSHHSCPPPTGHRCRGRECPMAGTSLSMLQLLATPTPALRRLLLQAVVWCPRLVSSFELVRQRLCPGAVVSLESRRHFFNTNDNCDNYIKLLVQCAALASCRRIREVCQAPPRVAGDRVGCTAVAGEVDRNGPEEA